MAVLRILSGEGKPDVLPLKGVVYLGREKSCDLQLAHKDASRRHARIYLDGQRYRIEDLGSKNGTFVNGIRISEPTGLQGGDEIMIGNLCLRFETGERPPAFRRRPVPVSSAAGWPSAILMWGTAGITAYLSRTIFVQLLSKL